jgi:hypothetical protein
METEKKRVIIEKYEVLLGDAMKSDPEGGHDKCYHEFKKVCSDNGYVGELQQQMWQSIVKRVSINSKKA